MAQFNVQPVLHDTMSRVKRVPKPPAALVHTYNSSDDGTDENLLILLHGLGEPTLLPWLDHTC